MPAWVVPAITATAGLIGQGIARGKDARQIKQQTKLQNLQIEGNKEMMDYQQKLQQQMWEHTGYGGQMRQLKEAGLNPALLYGMGGAGGQSIGNQTASVAGGMAPAGSGNESETMAQMGIQVAQQMKLLEAQRENIEADTVNKKAQTTDITASAEGKGLDNAFKAWMQSTTPEGKALEGGQESGMDKSIRGKKETSDIQKTESETKYKIDENDRQKLMNSKVMEEIGAKISLMAKQGQTQEQIYRNLQKEGKLLDAEIEWNSLDIESTNIGKFITNIIKMALRPR